MQWQLLQNATGGFLQNVTISLQNTTVNTKCYDFVT